MGSLPLSTRLSRSRLVRLVETALLFSCFGATAAALGLSAACMLAWARPGSSRAGWEGVCTIPAPWVVPLLYLGSLGAVPALLALLARAKTLGNAPRNVEVKSAAIFRGSGRAMARNDSARESLIIAQFCGAASACSLEVAFAATLIVVYKGNLSVAAAVVVVGVCAGHVFGTRASTWVRNRVDRLSGVVGLLLLERLSSMFSLGLLLVLMGDMYPKTMAVFPGSPSILEGAFELTSSSSATHPHPHGFDFGANSLDQWIAQGNSNSWLFSSDQASRPDTHLEAVFDENKDDMLRRGWLRLSVILLLSSCFVTSLSKHTRSFVLRRDWARLISLSPYTSMKARNSPTTEADLAGGAAFRTHLSYSSGSDDVMDDLTDEVSPSNRTNKKTTLVVDTQPSNYPTEDQILKKAQEQSLASLKISLARAHTAAYVATPVLLGGSFDLGPPEIAIAVGLSSAIIWQLLSFFLEVFCFRVAFFDDATLRTGLGDEDEEDLHAINPFGGSSIYRPIGVSPKVSRGEMVRQSLKAWRTYFRSPIFLASLSYVLLSASVIDCGLLTIAYLRWRMLPMWSIGALISLRCFTCGFISFVRSIHRYTGSLARTASLNLWMLWWSLVPALLGFAFYDPLSKVSIGFFLIAIILSGPFLRAFSLVHSKLVREWVEDRHQLAVLGAQSTLQTLALVFINLMAMTLQGPSYFGNLVLMSVLAAFVSALLFSIWYRVYDSGSAFQVVDDVGRLKLIVRG